MFINKNNFFILTLMLSLNSSSDILAAVSGQTSNIDCTASNNPTSIPTVCFPDFEPTIAGEIGNTSTSSIVKKNNSSSISVSVQQGKIPYNLNLALENGQFPDGNLIPGLDLTVNLSSQNQSSNAADFNLIADNFRKIDVNLNGHVGAFGKNASQLCADKIKKGTSAGGYGADTLSYFCGLRGISADKCNSTDLSSIPAANTCTIDDINFIQANKFNCNNDQNISGFKEILPTNGIYSTPDVYRIPKVNRCQTAVSYDLCLKKKVKLSCSWSVFKNNSFTGDITANSVSISNAKDSNNNLITSGGAVSVGLYITGVNSNGMQVFPNGTTITSISSGIVTVSKPAILTSNIIKFNVSTQYGTIINRTMSENQYNYLRNILNDSDFCNLHVAQEVSDTGYVAQGSTAFFNVDVLDFNKNSDSTVSSEFKNPYTIYGNMTPGSKTITFNSADFNEIISYIKIGQSIRGTHIPNGTTIDSVSTGSYSVSISNFPISSLITPQQIKLLIGVEVGQSIVSNVSGFPTALKVVQIKLLSNGTASSIILSDEQNQPDKSYTLTYPNGTSKIGFYSFSLADVINPLGSDPNLYAGCTNNSCIWQNTNLSVNLTTPGFIPNTDNIDPTSDWELKDTISNFNQHCDTSNNSQSGFWTTYKTITVSKIAFDPVNNPPCSNAKDGSIVTYNSNGQKNPGYPLQDFDPGMNATWVYTGIAQEKEFGKENVNCELGNCQVSSVVSDLTQWLDTLNPENGENGTLQGSGNLFIYDSKDIFTQANVGIAGSGGKNDLPQSTGAKSRVCYKKQDAITDPDSDFARNPIVSFNRYTWSGLKTGTSGSPGQQPANNGNVITVWKKLDTSVRELLKSYIGFPEN